ncbi:hypothetical protein [Burkholderia cenocepacia]|uniref:hypothetical protein n=1 Tax=Burkholderia cenocepacia TaxID=95486 RepID=UPI000A60354B|nr:hypothetical protein [Burkholderia cenocepacia]
MKITDDMLTEWFPVTVKPVRGGEYEGRERRTRLRIRVFWRKLDDTNHFDWYVYKGTFGPFALWECVSDKLSAWRGLTEKHHG